MRYVVAGIVLLVTFLFGISAYFYVANVGVENEKDTSWFDRKHVATTLIDNLKKINGKQWCLLVVAAACMTFLSYRLMISGMPVSEAIGYIATAIVLFAIMIVDWKTYKIPNLFVLALFGIGLGLLLCEFIFYKDEFLFLAIQRIAGLVICVVLFYALSRFTKDGIGMGDVKLIAVMGWMLGFSLTILAVMFSLIICSIVACFLLVLKKKDKNDKIPFGPFLFLGYISILLLIIF